MPTTVHSLSKKADIAAIAIVKMELFCETSPNHILAILIGHTVEWQNRGPVHTHTAVSELATTTHQYPLWNTYDALSFIAKISCKYHLECVPTLFKLPHQ